MFAQLFGGIGMFLLGMLLLTDGLKAAAGEALKGLLVRFTGRPASAFVSGMLVTALIQSSSATTLATIGFVSAGLLTFAQAVGVVIGGSVGTTMTGWLVSLLGLKLSVGKLALPLIGAGALMRLILKGRASATGLAIAGFGLIFVGIDTLQGGMAALSERVSPGALPTASLMGRLVLLLVGIVMTLIMQSSSAAIATTITAHYAGTLNLEQALALVIGASIGTTVTAALASIGASIPARRTALAHILFNAFAGLIGFLLQPLFVETVQRFVANPRQDSGALVIAAFHTSFTVLGAAVALPMADRLARLILRLLPDRGPVLTRHLDNSLVEVPEVALEAIRRTLGDCARELLGTIQRRFENERAGTSAPLEVIHGALSETRAFLRRIPPVVPPADRPSPRLAVVHAMDHIEQLTLEWERLPADSTPWRDPRWQPVREKLSFIVSEVLRWLSGEEPEPNLGAIEKGSVELAELRRTGRHKILEATAAGKLTAEQAAVLLESLRRMDSMAYHTWRAALHLRVAEGGSAPAVAKPAERSDSLGPH